MCRGPACRKETPEPMTEASRDRAGPSPELREEPTGQHVPQRGQADDLHDALAEAQRRRDESAALLAAAGAVLEHQDFTEAARAIFDSAKSLLGATAGYVAMLSPDGTNNDVLLLDAGGRPCTVDPSLPMPVRGLRAEAYRTAKPVYDNHFADSRWMKFMPARHVTLDNVLFAPMILDGKPTGLLGLANKPGGFTDNDAALAGGFAEFAAIALRNSKALQAVRKGEERYRVLVEGLNDGIWAIDTEGRSTFVNPRMAEMLGYTPEEMNGQPVFSFMPAAGVEVARRHMAACREGNPKRHDNIFLAKDGRPVHVTVMTSPLLDDQGNYVGGLAAVTDITERKRAELAIQNLAKFPAENPNPVLRISGSGNILYRNNASGPLIEAWNCREGEPLSGQWLQLVADALAAGQSQEGELACGERVFSLSFAPIVEAGYVNVYAHDITERKEMDRTRRFTRHLLVAANRHLKITPLLEEFVAWIKDFTGCEPVGILVADEKGSILYRAQVGCLNMCEASQALSGGADPCVCVNVLRGQVDSSLPFHTNGGSFHTNHMTHLLTTVGPGQRDGIRKASGEGGHESVALVPIHTGERTIGFIHVADARPDAIPRETVEILERMGLLLGTAVHRVRSDETLRATRDRLEHSVAERTADLIRTVEGLEGEVRDRIHAEEGLRQSEAKHRTLVEQIPAITYVVPLQEADELLYVSPQTERILGVSPEKFRTDPSVRSQRLHPDDRERVLAERARAYANGVPLVSEYRMISSDNRAVWFHDEAIVVRDENGTALFRQGIMLDITDRQRARLALQEGEKLAATGRMAARIAHEINNPLSGIKNSFLLIKDAISQDHPYFHYVDRIEREIERIARIVRQMFTVYRPEREGPSEFLLEEVLRDVGDILEHDLRLREVHLTAKLPSRSVPVLLEKDSVIQILYNILYNAIEASPRGGTIAMTATTRRRQARITVADEGSGIPENVREKVFEPFFTTKEFTGGAETGLGLGLSISRKLVESMGGSLTFEDRPGGGTVFTISLPLQKRPRRQETDHE